MKPRTWSESQISNRAFLNRSPPSSCRSWSAFTSLTSSDPTHTPSPPAAVPGSGTGNGKAGCSLPTLMCQPLLGRWARGEEAQSRGTADLGAFRPHLLRSPQIATNLAKMPERPPRGARGGGGGGQKAQPDQEAFLPPPGGLRRGPKSQR